MRILYLLALLVLLRSPAASAHHAFAADYSPDLTGSIEGKVVEVFYQNPHARLYVEVTTQDGETETWDVQTMNLMALSRLGWVKDTIQAGDTVEVFGNLGRDGTKRINILTLEQADGTVWRPMGGGNRVAQPSGAASLPPGTYEPDPNHAYLVFSYSHLGLSNPQLRFGAFEASLDLDGSNMQNSRVEVTIDAASIDTAVPALDDDLKGEAFFDVANHPEITFTSTVYEPLTPAAGRLTGDLTVKGVTRPVTLDVEINDAADNPMSREPTIGFSATGTLSRSDFGLGAMIPLVGDEISVEMQIEFIEADE